MTHPIRLGLALNYLVCLCEVHTNPDDACKMARTAFEDAIVELDNVGSDYAQTAGSMRGLINSKAFTTDGSVRGPDDSVTRPDDSVRGPGDSERGPVSA